MKEHLPHKVFVPAQGEWPIASPLTKGNVSYAQNHAKESTDAFGVEKSIN